MSYNIFDKLKEERGGNKMINHYKKTASKTRFNEETTFDLIEISNNLDLKVTFCSSGASIYSIYLKGRLITFAPDDFTFFCFNGLQFGKTLGRTAGRIKDGIAQIDGKEYHLYKYGKHTLHGGRGFEFLKYDFEEEEDDNEYRVIFSLISSDGDQGYPGQLENKIIYHVKKEENKIRIDFKAKSSKDTLCNLSNHVYWNLDGDMSKTIFDHELMINASKYVLTDEELIYKDILPVNKTHDFTKGKKIIENLFDDELNVPYLNGYDHDYILNKDGKDDAILYSSSKDIKMEVKTSYPVCHLFTANCFDEAHRYHCLALEFQKEVFFQDKIILRKDEIYDEFIEFSFEFNK